ncbi:MAG TPA: DMT family transporter [Opitutaceae bacterium]|nr:DMT family transporter [Opitutaceae bacterium]
MPPPSPVARHFRAVLMLVLANAFWALSFPLIKAIAFAHQQVVPGSGSWFVTACTLAPRFVLAAAILAAWQRGALRRLSRSEVRQAAGLALFASAGMLFQNDGLQFTSASTSAFLTQLYAILIPLWIALRTRRRPPATVGIACLLVLGGVAMLGRFDWHALRLGRGELETLVSSVFFMGQILWLDRAEFAANRAVPVTFVMFVLEAAAFTVMAVGAAPRVADLPPLLASAPWLGLTMLLTLFCTVGAFTLMNTWQPHVTATEAGLIYCLEPVFTAVVVLFLPAWFSAWAGFGYANETVTGNLVIGGGLITAANVLVQLRPPAKA